MRVERDLPDPGPGFRWQVGKAGGSPITLLRIPFLEDTGLVQAGFSSRIGGRSPEPWGTLNLGFFVGDDRDTVEENRRLLFGALNLDAGRAVGAFQVHGKGVTLVGPAEAGRGALSPDTMVEDTDAVITAEPGMALTIGCADCLALYLVDPVHRAIGLAHAGWRGTAQNIAAVMLGAMADTFDTDPDGVLAAVSPGIGGCCYEVDEAVWRGFGVEEAPALAAAFTPGEVRQGEQHWMLDLGKANRVRLEEAGVPAANIVVSPLCTACHPAVFFSHRRDRGRTGRMLAFLAINEPGTDSEQADGGGLRP